MEKEFLETVVNDCLETGADFSEVFYENSKTKIYKLIDSKLEDVNVSYLKGVGIRIAKDNNIVYGHTNDISTSNINSLVLDLRNNFSKKRVLPKITLATVNNIENAKLSHDKLGDEAKKQILKHIDMIARTYDKRVIQVETSLYEYEQFVSIANSQAKYISDVRCLTRLNISVIAKDSLTQEKSVDSFILDENYDIDGLNLEMEVKKLAESAIKKLSAKPCPSGEMPVIIANGSGAVIFHEACGHAMEATTVADGISVLSNKLGEKIASDKVTIIDDGTIPHLFGTTNIDDEGNLTQKNVLIEKGILKGYLIDELNTRKMSMEITGSGRRENYHYAPTSRMNNTYLAIGNDEIDDMIKSIDFGIYAKSLGGGSVNPITGNFNFAVDEAYLIEKGKITDMVKGGSLIGNTLDILNKVEMVSNDLNFKLGLCGSKSGYVPVTIGEPTIKVSSILVGGE